MSIKCLIIDDEPLAQRVIERYAEEVTFLDIVRKCNNSLDALELLRSHDIELIFLDINMPKLSGLEFLRTLKNPPLIIITTAYASYAVQGFELGVVDYLMKPFSFDRFLKAVQKAQDILSSRKAQQAEPHVQEKQEEQHIFIKSSKKTYRVRIEDILYIEALGDYVKIFTTERMIVSYQSLKNIENLLPPASFPRIHKSYIIALSKVDTIEGNHVKIRNQVIPIGSNFKAGFDRLIRSI
jgi:DNA-binding LytR/AlgR family response regulator